MKNEQLLAYIRDSRKHGLNDDAIKKELKDTGWQDVDIDEAFREMTTNSDNIIPEKEPTKSAPGFKFKETIQKLSLLKQHPKFKHILTGVVLALILGFSFVQFGTINPVKIFGPERVEIAEFELTASISDAAGISPDSIFILKSTADLDEGVIKKYIKVEPSIEFDVDKKGTGVFEIKPKEKLPENKIFTVIIEPGPIADKLFSWAYQVKAPFQVISTLPRDQGTSVPLNSGIEITFNREGVINPDSSIAINPNVSGRFEIHRNVLVFVPTQQLQPKTIYTVTVERGLKVQGSDDTLSEDSIFKFETSDTQQYGYSYFDFDKRFWEFKPDNEPAFEVTYYSINNVSNLPAKVYRFDSLNEFLGAYKDSLQKEKGWSRFNSYIPYKAPDDKKVFESNLSVENQLNVRFIRVPQILDEGYYMMDLVVDGESRQAWFQVNNLANYLAVSGTQSLVWLKSLDNEQAISDAEVFFDGNKLGQTNNDGIAQFNTPDVLTSDFDGGYYSYSNELPYFYTIKSNGKEWAIPIESRYGGFRKVSQPDQWWDYISVDKTIYRPTDTLRFWGIVKQRNGSDVKGEELVMQLTDPFWFGTSPDDVTVYAQAKATVGDFYTVTGEMNYAGLKSGLYQLSIKRGNEIIISENISVEAFIKPAYRFILSPDKNAVFAGDSINFNVKAEFFDGTPVSNLKVKYSGYFNGSITGDLKLNNDGEGNFTFKTNYTESRFWPRYLSMTVSPAVSEEGEIAKSISVLIFGPNMNLKTNQTLSSGLSKFNLKLKKIFLEKVDAGQPFWVSDNYLGDAVSGHPINVEVIEITHTRTETGKGYDFINKITYPKYTYSREEKSIRKDIVTTNASGEASFEQVLEKERSYKIIFTTNDSNGRLVKVERYAYGGTISSFGYYDAGGIVLKNLDEKSDGYKLGEEISLQIQDTAGNMLDTSPRNFIFMRVTGGIDSYKINDDPNYKDTFNSDYIPNVNIIGVWFSGSRFHDSWPINLSFDSDDRRLNISVSKDKDRYKPGDEVRLSIQVTDQQGRPKAAEVNISALDEAVFTLNPQEKDIANDLYRDISISLLTRSSHLTPLESGAERGGCFLPGTQIITTLGNQNIEDIRVGDYIMTKASDNSIQFVKARVKRITSHIVDGYLVINDQLRVTDNHRLFVNNKWLKAGQVKIGDLLLDFQGNTVEVSSIQRHDEWLWVHNFEVEGQHTYFADGFYVHNEEKGGGEARGDFKDVAIYRSVITGSNGKANVSFDVPDNITSWRLTLQAVSKDLYAGKTTEFIPVGLPFFVETALNNTYLTGDNLILRTRVFGTASIPNVVNYQIKSDTLPFKTVERSGSKIEEFDLGNLTSGRHKLEISANSGNYSDAIIREIEVLDSYFMRSVARYNDISPSLTDIEGNKEGFTELLFISRERGKLYPPLRHFLWSRGARVDQLGSRYFANIFLNTFFDEQRNPGDIDFRQYQTRSGGMALLPYSDDDLELSAKFADLIKDEDVDVSTSALKDYFYQVLNDRKTDLSRVVIALYGLASFDEPVLVTLQNLKDDKDLTTMDKAFIALALDVIGAKEEARQYYNKNFKPQFIIKQPYVYINDSRLNDDQDKVLTAMLANLAGSLQEDDADGLAAYVFENRPKDFLVNFELLSYIKKSMQYLKEGDVSFTYRTNQKNDTVRLKKGDNFRLVLGADELKTLRFDNIDGKVGVVSFYDQEISPEQLTKDSDIGLKRTYFVDGRPTIEFNDGDVVKIELASTFRGRALPGLYQITDYLPSGLRAVTRLNIAPFRQGTCIRYPSVVNDQKITFLDWNPKSSTCSNIFYYARVVNKGNFNAEPALIQSIKNLESLNLSNPAKINIK